MQLQSAWPSLSGLPIELLLLMCENLSPVDLNSLMKAVPRFAPLLDSLLYTKAVTYICKDGDAVLVWAARKGRPRIVEKLISSGLNRIADKERFLALYYAAVQGHEEIVRLLLTTLPDANRPELRCIHHAEHAIVKQLLDAGMDPYVDVVSTTLDAAAKAGHLNIVRLLLDSGVDLKSQSDGLPAAATAGHEEVVRLLLAAGMNAFPTTISYALRAAAQEGHLSVVRLLLDAYAPYGHPPFQALDNALNAGHESIVETILASDKSIPEKLLERALSSAVAAGREGMVRLLLGAITNPPSKVLMVRLLQNAARHGHEATVKVILGVLTRQSAEEGSAEEILPSVLHQACETGRAAIVQLLLDAGAHPSVGPRPSELPLLAAARRGHLEVARLLVDRGADIKAQNHLGWTPLHEAAFHGQPEVLRVLLQAGVDASLPNARGETALHRAAVGGYTSVVQELLKSGAKVDARDNRQLTPLHMAAYEGREEVVMLLVQAGANLSVQHPVGWTPLDLAALRGHKGAVKLLLSTSGLDPSEDNVKSVLASIAKKTSSYNTERMTFLQW